MLIGMWLRRWPLLYLCDGKLEWNLIFSLNFDDIATSVNVFDDASRSWYYFGMISGNMSIQLIEVYQRFSFLPGMMPMVIRAFTTLFLSSKLFMSFLLWCLFYFNIRIISLWFYSSIYRHCDFLMNYKHYAGNGMLFSSFSDSSSALASDSLLIFVAREINRPSHQILLKYIAAYHHDGSFYRWFSFIKWEYHVWSWRSVIDARIGCCLPFWSSEIVEYVGIVLCRSRICFIDQNEAMKCTRFLDGTSPDKLTCLIRRGFSSRRLNAITANYRWKAIIGEIANAAVIISASSTTTRYFCLDMRFQILRQHVYLPSALTEGHKVLTSEDKSACY